MGWLFIHTQRGDKERYAPDLIKDPVISFVDRTFISGRSSACCSRSRSAG